MRLAVLADVHGNLPALEAVLDDIHRYTVEGIIVAGDHTALPQANETIRLLRSLGSWMILGNSDDNLLRYDAGDAPEAWRTSRQFGLLRFAHRHLDKDSMECLKLLPEQRVIERWPGPRRSEWCMGHLAIQQKASTRTNRKHSTGHWRIR
jgi:predicted phosphodiesterase